MITHLVGVVPYEQVDYWFITNHYDHHLNGLCFYEGQLCWFHTVFEGSAIDVYVYSLSWYQKKLWLLHKNLFEACVGSHWTYKDGKRMTTFEPNTRLNKLYFSYIKPVLKKLHDEEKTRRLVEQGFR